MRTITESIYSGPTAIIPMAEVQHVQKCFTGDGKPMGGHVITSKTRWDNETGGWANPIYFTEDELTGFLRAWCHYRSELESETLMDLTPQA